jgi:hypothetical protein
MIEDCYKTTRDTQHKTPPERGCETISYVSTQKEASPFYYTDTIYAHAHAGGCAGVGRIASVLLLLLRLINPAP